MALTPQHFLAPPVGRGPFPPEYFPGEEDKGLASTNQRINRGNELATAITAGAERDEAVTHYVNWQTANRLYITLLGVPTSVSAPQGAVSVNWTQDQRDKLLAYLEGEQALWEELVAAEELTPTPVDPFPFGSVPKDIRWE